MNCIDTWAQLCNCIHIYVQLLSAEHIYSLDNELGMAVSTQQIRLM